MIEQDRNTYSMRWGSVGVPKEIIMARLEALLRRFKDEFYSDLKK